MNGLPDSAFRECALPQAYLVDQRPERQIALLPEQPFAACPTPSISAFRGMGTHMSTPVFRIAGKYTPLTPVLRNDI
jgi:hypothetical protein